VDTQAAIITVIRGTMGITHTATTGPIHTDTTGTEFTIATTAIIITATIKLT